MNSKQFLKEGFLEDAQEAHSDHEVQMARVDCYYAAEHAIVLHKLLRNISEEQGLEGWVASKITLANDYLKSVREHLEYQMMNVDAGEDDFLPLAEGLKPVKKNSVVESTAPVAEDEEEKFQDFERGPWYVILKGKAVTVNGIPKKFNWLNGAKTYFRSMMDKNPEMAQKIKREYDEASDKKSVIYYTKNLPADSTTSTEQPVSESEKPGLWANIRAKRERIKGGSGERMRKPGSKGAPSDADIKSIRAASESVVKESDFHSQFAAMIDDMKKSGKLKTGDSSKSQAKYAPEQSREDLERRLRELESEFDPAYQYSDDYSFWTKQNAIAREIASIKKKLGSQGVSEGEFDQWGGEIKTPPANWKKGLKQPTSPAKLAKQKAVKRQQKQQGVKQQGVAEGYSLKKTNVSKYIEPGDTDEYTQDINIKDTDYEIINNKTGQVVGTASWTTNDYFGPGALKITMKNGATRWLDIYPSERGNPQTAFNRFVKDPKTAKKYKEEGVAEGSGAPEITPGMKTQYGTVVSVNGNTVTVKTSNGELTTVNIHDIQQGVAEGYKNTYNVGDRVDSPLGTGTVVAVSKNVNVDGRVRVKLDDPSKAGEDGKYQDSFVLNTTQLKHIDEQGVMEGSDSHKQSHLDAFKSETDTMKPGTKKYVGRKDGKEVYAKKDAQGNVKFYHRDGIKGPLKGVAEGSDQNQLDKIVSNTDTVLQSSGMKRQGFDVVPDATQTGVRGSITPSALNMVKSNLARAKNISTTAGVKPSPDPVPLKQPWQVTDKDFGVNESKVDEACWKGYRKEGMKTMFGKKYPNCVKNTKSVKEVTDKKISETTAGSIAGVVNPKIKNKSKVGTLFGGTYKQQKDK